MYFVSTVFVLISLTSVYTFAPLDCPLKCTPNKSNSSDPICASNGIAYESMCEMLKSNCSLTQADWEKCRGNHPLCPSDCLDIQDPVCADDGKIYPNKCVMHKRNCGKKIFNRSTIYCFGKNRQGRKFETCRETCLELYKPVCGSDKQIYLNECHLRQKNCGNDVKLVPMNHCVVTPSCPEYCIPLYDPVCGSDGKVYLNHCKMLFETCKSNVKRMSLRFCVGENEEKV